MPTNEPYLKYRSDWEEGAGFGIVLAVFLGMLLTADGMAETLVSSTLRRSGTP